MQCYGVHRTNRLVPDNRTGPGSSDPVDGVRPPVPPLHFRGGHDDPYKSAYGKILLGGMVGIDKANLIISPKIFRCIFRPLKLRALILSLCTLFYLVEYTAVPRILAQSSAACSNPSAPHTETCCHRPSKPEERQCPGKRCNPLADCCLNCPFCYVTLLPAQSPTQQQERKKTEYNLWSSSYIYLYHASCWKPPSAA